MKIKTILLLLLSSMFLMWCSQELKDTVQIEQVSGNSFAETELSVCERISEYIMRCESVEAICYIHARWFSELWWLSCKRK